MNTFEISPEIKKGASGVYLISFSTGHYYFGSSEDIHARVKCHITSLKKDSTTKPCKTLANMKIIAGHATFSLVECFESKVRLDLYYREWEYIESNIGDPRMLNDPSVTGSGIGRSLHKEITSF